MKWRLAAVAVALFLAALLAPRRAEAYPWMIRHGYAQCGNCHADPAGGGLLNPYGRAQGEILMRMRYGAPADTEPGPLAEPVWGLLPELPRALLVGGAVRWARVQRLPLGGETDGRFILMQGDALAQYKVWRLRANASVGYVTEGGNAAAVTGGVDDKVVSRVHWVGVDLGRSDEVLVRAGRMNVPFGIRSIEHTMFPRAATRSDINTGQQHGVSIDYRKGPLRASLMGIAGNFQIQQDRFRSRGYSGLAELAIRPTLAAGVSSMVTNTELDLALLTPTWRHAHGAFVRYSPARVAVVSAEWDFLHTSQPTPGTTYFGGVGMVQVDLEPVQGLHLGPTVEVLTRDFDERASYGIWASAWWFFFSHADVRFDAIGQRLSTPGGAVQVVTGVLQVHAYL
jgi:hypothetical protein